MNIAMETQSKINTSQLKLHFESIINYSNNKISGNTDMKTERARAKLKDGNNIN